MSIPNDDNFKSYFKKKKLQITVNTLIINQRESLIYQIYFWNMTVHVSDSNSVHLQESSTVHTATGACHRGYADCLLTSSQHNLYDIYLLLCVQCQTPEDGQRYCPKHVQSYSKNKFEKLVSLIGFIIRLYQDVKPSECQIHCEYVWWVHI